MKESLSSQSTRKQDETFPLQLLHSHLRFTERWDRSELKGCSCTVFCTFTTGLGCCCPYVLHVSSTVTYSVTKVNVFGLRQVVSEVLFPSAVSSSPAQRCPVLPDPPAGPSSAPPDSSGPPHETQTSVEVMAHLLQEAEGELCAGLQQKLLARHI